MKPTVPLELLNLVQALAAAVQMDFMAREHAAIIWKKCLKVSGFDVAKDATNREGGVTNNVIVKEG